MNIHGQFGGTAAPNSGPSLTNLTIGQRCHDALLEAAQAKVAAMTKRRWAERAFDISLLKATGKNSEERKASARMDPVFSERDDAAHEAECAAIVAKANADGLQIQFEQWRTEQATNRAEMQMR